MMERKKNPSGGFYEVSYAPDSCDVLMAVEGGSVDILPYSSYASALSIHRKCGGWLESVSGGNGAAPTSARGVVPVTDSVGLVNTYYFSQEYVMYPRVETRAGLFRGVEVYVCVDASTGQLDRYAPVIIVKGTTDFRHPVARPAAPAVLILARDDFDRYWLGEPFSREVSRSDVEINYVAEEGTRYARLAVAVEYTYKLSADKLRMAVEGLFVKQVGFAWSGGRPAFESFVEEPHLSEPFFNCLGLYRTGGPMLYRLQGPSRPAICRGSVSADDVHNADRIREIAPAGVSVIDDHVVLTETGGGFRAVAYFEFGKVAVHVETDMGRQEGLEVIDGDCQSLLDQLESVAAHRSEQASRAASMHATELSRLASGHEHEEISFRDVLRVGLEIEWLAKVWEQRGASKRPTVGDILKHCEGEAARFLLVCKLASDPEWPAMANASTTVRALAVR